MIITHINKNIKDYVSTIKFKKKKKKKKKKKNNRNKITKKIIKIK